MFWSCLRRSGCSILFLKLGGGMAKSKWYTLAIICLAQMLCAVDNSIMYNSLSSLLNTFHSSVTAIQLANSIYPLIAGALMLAGGLLGLKIGWKKLLYIGLLITLLGEIAATLSPDILFFTWIARVLAGLGASLAVPAVIGMVPVNYSGKDIAIGFGAIGASVGFASLAGPIIGGWIIDSFGWRSAFFVLAIALGINFIGALMIKEKSEQRLEFKFDFIGTILFALSMILITLGIINITVWSAKIFVPFLVSGCIILIAFIFYELDLEKKRNVVLFPSIFYKSKQTFSGLIMTALIFFISGGLSFSMITYLQIDRGFSALHTGLFSMIVAIGIILFSIGTPIIIKNVNPKKICQLSIILVFISGMVIAASIEKSSLSSLFYVGIFIAGVAIGLLSSQAGVIVTSSIPENYAAQSGGIQGSMRNIGQAIGIALIGLIMISALTHSVKKTIINNPITRPLMTAKVKLTETVPFLSDKQLEEYLRKTHLDEAEKQALIENNNQSRIKALRISFGSFGIIILLFFVFTFQIPKTYKTSKEVVS